MAEGGPGGVDGGCDRVRLGLGVRVAQMGAGPLRDGKEPRRLGRAALIGGQSGDDLKRVDDSELHADRGQSGQCPVGGVFGGGEFRTGPFHPGEGEFGGTSAAGVMRRLRQRQGGGHRLTGGGDVASCGECFGSQRSTPGGAPGEPAFAHDLFGQVEARRYRPRLAAGFEHRLEEQCTGGEGDPLLPSVCL
ncbi:MAG: hypothetical protein ACRDYF_06530, partial [Acidimicrobiia bacterium]